MAAKVETDINRNDKDNMATKLKQLVHLEPSWSILGRHSIPLTINKNWVGILNYATFLLKLLLSSNPINGRVSEENLYYQTEFLSDEL